MWISPLEKDCVKYIIAQKTPPSKEVFLDRFDPMGEIFLKRLMGSGLVLINDQNELSLAPQTISWMVTWLSLT